MIYFIYIYACQCRTLFIYMHVNAEHKLFGYQHSLQYLLVCAQEKKENHTGLELMMSKWWQFSFFGKLGQLKGTYFALCYCIFIYFLFDWLNLSLHLVCNIAVVCVFSLKVTKHKFHATGCSTENTCLKCLVCSPAIISVYVILQSDCCYVEKKQQLLMP